jgi:cation/acetate symporter
MIKGKFIDNLPKVYGIYTGGFIGFIILMAIGEQMGMSAKAIGIAFVAFTIFIYALIGYLSRTAQADAYYVAGRQVPTVFNGMATAADWMSGASFVAMAGGIYFKGLWLYGSTCWLDWWLHISCNFISTILKKIWLLHSSRFHRYKIRW